MLRRVTQPTHIAGSLGTIGSAICLNDTIKSSDFYKFVSMTNKDQILSFISQNKKLLLDKFHITRIGLFGSYARGEQKDTSDIDLLVEFEENTQDLYDLKLQLKEFFRDKFGIEIDICREKYLKPRVKKTILKETVYA